MSFIYKLYKHSTYPFILAFLLSLFFMLPLFNIGIPEGHDLWYHMSRIKGSYELLNVGVFPAKVLPGFYFDYGYAVGLFYPAALLYIPVFLMKLGLNEVTAYLCFVSLINIGTSLSMFYTTKTLSKSRYTATLATIFYVFASYRVYTDFYSRQALGELIGMMFIPMIFLGMYHITFGNYKKWSILSIGMLGLVTSHTLSTILATAFLSIYSIVYIKNYIREPKRFLFLCLSAVVTIALCFSYLISMWQMMSSDIFQYMIPWTQALWNQLDSISQIFYHLGLENVFPFGIDLIIFIIAFIGILFQNYKCIKIPLVRLFGALTLISIFLTLKIVPVGIVEKLDFMQFIWRIFTFVSFFVAYLAATSGSLIKRHSMKIVVGISLIIYILTSYLIFSDNYLNTHVVYQQIKGYSFEYDSAEFIPEDANMPKLFLRSLNQQVISNNEIDYTYKRDASSYYIYFSENNLNDSAFEVPLLYYFGYAAYITSPQGEGFLEISKSENSLITINVGNYTEGSIRIFYNGTSLQKYSFYIQIIGWIFFLIYLGKNIKDSL